MPPVSGETREASDTPNILKTFYTVESVLTYCITTRYSSCYNSDTKTVQRVIRGAEKIIGVDDFTRHGILSGTPNTHFP